ncbi:MAG: type I methionyl aminopeptidase [Acidobacteriota bacterium]
MIICKSRDEIEKMKKANKTVSIVLNELKNMIKPGVSVELLDKVAEEMIRKMGGIPAFKGYKPSKFAKKEYPYTICTSINEEIVHGMPVKRILKEGQIISIDLGVRVDGYYGDAAITVPVGKISDEAERLIRVTENALFLAIEEVRVGNRISDISYTIQSYVESNGFSVIRDFVGHGIGSSLHEEPQIPNFGQPGQGIRIKEGMTFAIEPMVSMGSYEVEILEDSWTAVTKDRSFAAHFEHTVAVFSDGPEILSLFNSSKN